MNLIHTTSSHPTASFDPKRTKNIPWRFNKKISGGGNFLDMGIHMIDMIDYLLGEIKTVKSINKNYLNYYNVDDTVSAQFELKNGIIGNGLWCSVADKDEDEFEIFGSKGLIKFSMNKNNKVLIKCGDYIKVKKIPFEKPFHKNMINYVIKKFLFLKKHKKHKVFEEGIKASKVYLSCY